MNILARINKLKIELPNVYLKDNDPRLAELATQIANCSQEELNETNAEGQTALTILLGLVPANPLLEPIVSQMIDRSGEAKGSLTVNGQIIEASEVLEAFKTADVPLIDSIKTDIKDYIGLHDILKLPEVSKLELPPIQPPAGFNGCTVQIFPNQPKTETDFDRFLEALSTSSSTKNLSFTGSHVFAAQDARLEAAAYRDTSQATHAHALPPIDNDYKHSLKDMLFLKTACTNEGNFKADLMALTGLDASNTSTELPDTTSSTKTA